MDKLLDKIKKDFEEFSQRNKHIQDLIKKFDSGKATLPDIDAIAKATGYALQVAIKKNVAENVAAFADEETVAAILKETFKDNYEMINAIAQNVQKRLDEAAGINIKPQKAAFPTKRVKNLAKFVAGKDLTDDKVASEFGAAVENLNGSMYADYVKANADFRSKAGLKVYVTRKSNGKCCEWCDKLLGKHVYPDVPKEVWQRHKRCTCEITYANEKAGTYDRIRYTDHAVGEKYATTKQVTRLTPEQAKQLQDKVLTKNK